MTAEAAEAATRCETVIVGGGIAGLACARRLSDSQHGFRLMTEDVGGRVRRPRDERLANWVRTMSGLMIGIPAGLLSVALGSSGVRNSRLCVRWLFMWSDGPAPAPSVVDALLCLPDALILLRRKTQAKNERRSRSDFSSFDRVSWRKQATEAGIARLERLIPCYHHVEEL